MARCRVAHLIYSKKIGGSEMVAANVCSNLDRNRFEPMVLFMYKSTGAMPEVLSSLGVASSSFELTRFSSLFRSLIVSSVLNRLKIDILHVHHIPLYMKVALGVRLSRVKGVVFTEHAKFSISRSVSLQDGCRRAAKDADYFTTVSDNLKQYFVSELGLSEKAIEVVLNGVDTKRFSPDNIRGRLVELLPASATGKLLISVGRLTEAKDQECLLYAMKKLIAEGGADVSLALVGEGELRGRLEARISELGLGQHVFLLGNRTDVHELLPDAAMFVLSSRREGLPMVLLEAMASGLPVVATNVGGIPEVVKEGDNGFLAPPENPESLAEKIGLMLSEPERSAAMGLSGREMVEKFYSMQKTAQRYAQLYENIMAKY
ncbi:glycosyltransferase family 4 protein [Thiovibrio sp. JS02]